MSRVIPADVQLTLRDGDQSNKGTKMPAQDFVAQVPSVHQYGIDRIQITGGTFWAEPARSGHWPEEFNQTIGDHFGGGKLIPSALYRSVFGLAMTPQSISSHARMMRVLAENAKVKVLQNFHGMNDPRLMGFVPKLAADHGMTAMATLCVQVNPNTMDNMQKILDQHYADLEMMLEQGHKGIYLKNANGIMLPAFTDALIRGIRQRFGYEHEIGVHTHNTYGLGIDTYLAAIRANEGKGRIVVDVLPDAIADGTAQPSLQMLLFAIKYSGDPFLVASIPQGINMQAIEADALVQYRMRGIYRGNEMEYDPVALQEAFLAGAAGGSIGVLKGQQGIRAMLERNLGTDDWGAQRSAIYAATPRVRESLGFPTNVTPYQNMMDSASAQAVPALRGGKDFVESMLLLPSVRQYAVGAWGRVSPDIDPELQRRALVKEGLSSVVEPKTAEEMPDSMESARTVLVKNGVENPTEAEIHIMAMIGNGWKPDCPARALIEGTRNQMLTPRPVPELPAQLREGGLLASVTDLIFEVVYKARSVQMLQDGFYQGLDPKIVNAYAVQVQKSIDDIMDVKIPSALEAVMDEKYVTENRKKHGLGRALDAVNRQIMEISLQLGVREEEVPQKELKFKLSTADDVLNLVGWDDLRALAGHYGNQAVDEIEKFMGQLTRIARDHGFLPQQIDVMLPKVEARAKQIAEARSGSFSRGRAPESDGQDLTL